MDVIAELIAMFSALAALNEPAAAQWIGRCLRKFIDVAERPLRITGA